MNSNQTINRSNSRKHYHEQSMDDFMKNIKKFNLRSQRYISPKPLLYMYAKNNTTNTIQKSRSKTHSNCKSNHSKSKRSKKDKDKQKHGKSSVKYIKSKLQKIFQKKQSQANRNKSPGVSQNPAILIEKCGEKLKKAQKILQSKNTIGYYLCQQFLQILNDIVQKMVKQLDKQLKQLQNKTQKQIQRKFIGKLKKMEKQNKKMDKIIQEMSEKAQNNSRLLYQIRKKCQMDIDYLFGKAVLGTQQCGGFGYSKNMNANQQFSIQSFREDRRPQEVQQFSKVIRTNQQFIKESENKRNLRIELKKQIQLNLQFSQKQKQSGRIRQAYDWQREAYDAREKQKNRLQNKNITKQFVTFLQNENEEGLEGSEQDQQAYNQFQNRMRFARKST